MNGNDFVANNNVETSIDLKYYGELLMSSLKAMRDFILSNEELITEALPTSCKAETHLNYDFEKLLKEFKHSSPN